MTTSIYTSVLNRLLRAPGDIAASCRDDRDTRAIAATSLVAVAVGAAVFGGVVGTFRGGVQMAYGAIKMPLAILLTLAIAVPAFHALAAGFGKPMPFRSSVALALAAAGRSALVLVALAPALWLALDLGLSYHAAAAVAAIAYGVAGLAALSLLLRGLGKGAGRLLTAFTFIGVFIAVGGQTSWIMRPYLVRPKAKTVVFLQQREGSFADALYTTSRSAMTYGVRRSSRAMDESELSVEKPSSRAYGEDL